MNHFSSKLQQWYHLNKRDLPWRHTQDAYLIWLSEIILQQTQVKQGLPYYLKFSEHYPTVQDLAKANEEEVLKLWQGLGYYSRARNLHTAAKQVMAEYNGKFPTRYEHLIQLKGVGDYTASAVASFSSGEAKACVDGNVIRVISRLFNMNLPYDSSAGQKTIRALAYDQLDKNNSATHNQAIMEFGALQCTPKTPQCESCIFQEECSAFADNKVHLLPYKSKKTKVQNLHLYYFVLICGKDTLIQQRSSSGIWKNMYEFPLLESKTALSEIEILKHCSTLCPKHENISFSPIYDHVLSHRKIQATFIEVQCSKALPAIKGTLRVAHNALADYPVSRLIERFWDNYTLRG